MNTETKKYVEEYVEQKLHHFATLLDEEFNEKTVKNIRGVTETLDKGVDDKINSKLLSHFDKKLSTLQIVLAAFAVHLAIVFYFNNKSTIEARLLEQNKTLNNLALDLNTLKNNDRPSGWGSEGHRRKAGPEPLKEDKK